jgi:anti-sigma regulatory factor (Ser/Thr protein kinase)
MEMLSASVARGADPGRRRELHDVRAFAATTRSAGVARHWLREILREAAIPDEQMHSLELLASELIASTIAHTPATVVTVRVSLVDDSVSVAVRDPVSEARTSTYAWDPDADGQGLAIVARVSSCWGIRCVAGAKELWFRLDCPRHLPGVLASS